MIFNQNLISQELERQMEQWRQDIHAHPETAFEEVRTSKLVEETLRDMGLPVETGIAQTGLVATLKNGAGPTIGLRADMDALDIHELTDKPYASKIPGKMHACGHDGHTAMLLGAARYLTEHRPFKGTVHFIFQPAEENEGGGRVMVEEGLFERFPCDAVFGLHNAPRMPLGHFGIRSGPMLSASDFFAIEITGTGAHAAYPQSGTDAIVAGSQLVLALQQIVSRNNDPLNPLVVSVTEFRGGDTWNVLPETVVIRGTCRCFSEDVRTQTKKRFEEICAGIQTQTGATVQLDYIEGYPATVNEEQATQHAIAAAQTVAGKERVNTNSPQRMGSEDFGFMQQACPGAYIVMGTSETGDEANVHNPYYDFNDNALSLGASYWITLVKQFCPA
ncbi:MAG TPA: M20 aminoacylase family protein [Paenalcaligenes sp.]|nr:M20 aminoacylase family protein [Paenalcaligenes sp.]